MKNNTLFSETNSATYCPEDDKLRLYVGRVPHDEYKSLRAEGWTSTPKQDCDFVAVWTPSREDTAESYAGIILDEDSGPDERAADRAERFGGYLDKRLGEATGHADRFDAGPSAHGFQSRARAVRAADRHDRIAGRAVNAWDKAEYWQSRTAGVISHALHLQSPCVRMGRIKTLEAELRAAEKTSEKYAERFRWVQRIAANTEDAIASLAARSYSDDEAPEAAARHALSEEIAGYGKHRNPCDLAAPEGYYFEHQKGEHPPTVADYVARYLATHHAPDSEGWETTGCARTIQHLKLRIAYELQMLEAQGGRAALVEMEVGGFIGGHQIHKINKSPATGRVVSVGLKVRTNGKNIYGNPDPSQPEFRLTCTNIERLSESSYRAPTDAERAEFHTAKKQAKAAAPKSTAPPLINPTREDAERLQALINARYLAEWTRQHGTESKYYTPKEPGTVCAIPQDVYSANSKGSYARAETKDLCALGEIDTGHRQSSASKARAARIGPVLCKVRMTGYEPARVVHITDKPAKKLPESMWSAYAPAVTPETLKPRALEMVRAIAAEWGTRSDFQNKLVADGVAAGLVNDDCMRCQLTEAGHEWAREAGAFAAH